MIFPDIQTWALLLFWVDCRLKQSKPRKACMEKLITRAEKWPEQKTTIMPQSCQLVSRKEGSLTKNWSGPDMSKPQYQQPQATGQTVRHAACRMKDFVCHSFQVLMSLLSTRNWFAALILTRSCHNKKVSSYKLGNPRGALYMFQSATKRTQVRIHCLRRFWQPHSFYSLCQVLNCHAFHGFPRLLCLYTRSHVFLCLSTICVSPPFYKRRVWLYAVL